MSTDPVGIAPDAAGAPAPSPRGLPLWLAPLAGVAAALLGLLPWLVTGIRLPLQNLWDAATDASAMPLVMLPFSQYYLTTLFALIATGSVAAGVAARALRPRLPRGGFWLLVGGVLLVQAIAIVQTAVTVERGLQERSESTLYLAALVAVCVLSVLIGFGALALIALAPRAGALIGLTIGAISVGGWLSAWVHPLLITSSDVVLTVAGLLQWVPAILVGVAIAWTGLGSVGKVAPTRAVLDRALPSPGSGPSAEAIEHGRFALDVDVYPVEGQPVRTRVTAPYDPGYGGTGVMLAESALSLAFDDLPDRAGVLTPMVAMGEHLAERLRAHGFTLDVGPLPYPRS